MEVATSTPKHRGRFQKGRSGNPSGRPLGARNKTTLAAEGLLLSEAERLTEVCIKRALNGDGLALRLCLERILPIRKDRLVHVELPSLKTSNDLQMALMAIIEATSNGKVMPCEGQALAGLIEAARKMLETNELEQRLRALEDRTNGIGQP